MNSNQLSLLLISILYANAFDPDVDICEKSSVLNSAINSVDGYTYIFKGDYYWQTRPLDNQTGIIGFGDLIKNKWPEIDEPIVAAFALFRPPYQTVFVFKNKWIAYEKDGKVSRGSTDKWPQFKKLPLNTMISIDLTKSEIFAIYDNSKRFHEYDFSDLSEPKLLKSGDTASNDGFLWFIDNPGGKGRQTLANILQVITSISYSRTLVFMSKNKYCKVNLNAPVYEKKCEPGELIYYLLGCKLDLKGRTSATPTKSTSTVNNSDRVSSSLTDLTHHSNQSPLDSTTKKSMLPQNNSTAEELLSKDERKSKVIVFIIIGVIVVVVIGVVVGIIILMLTKRPKTSKNARSNLASKSIATIQTVNSETGAPVGSKSIISLREVSNRN